MTFLKQIEFFAVPLLAVLACFPATYFFQRARLNRWWSLAVFIPAFVVAVVMQILSFLDPKSMMSLTNFEVMGAAAFVLMMFPIIMLVRRLGVSTWWFLIAVIPGGGFVGLWMLAFAEWPVLSKHTGEPVTPLPRN